jgi:hypothetical protein
VVDDTAGVLNGSWTERELVRDSVTGGRKSVGWGRVRRWRNAGFELEGDVGNFALDRCFGFCF